MGESEKYLIRFSIQMPLGLRKYYGMPGECSGTGKLYEIVTVQFERPIQEARSLGSRWPQDEGLASGK